MSLWLLEGLAPSLHLPHPPHSLWGARPWCGGKAMVWVQGDLVGVRRPSAMQAP